MNNNLILIIDDNENDYLIMSRILNNEYSTFYNNGEDDVIELIDKMNPLCILLDYHIGNINGIDILIKIKAKNKYSHIPVIMLTAEMNVDIVVDCMKYGAVDYIIKGTYDKDQIIKTITNSIEKTKIQLELEISNKTKDKLFSIIAHDLQGPIGTLSNLFDFIKKNKLNNMKIDEIINLLYGPLKSAQLLLNNLLNWSKKQLDGFKISKVELDFNKLVNEIFNMKKDLSPEKSIELVSNIPHGQTIFADENMIALIIRNLVSNAIKFTPNKGKITISITGKSDYYEIKVNDTGIGISPDKIEEILDNKSFYSTRGINREKGSGLGILVCNEFITAHGGTISIDSSPGVGTTITVTLPVK